MQLRVVALVFAVSSLVACTERETKPTPTQANAAPVTAATPTTNKLDPKTLQVLKLNPAIKALKPSGANAAAEPAAVASVAASASVAPSASAAPAASAPAAASAATQKKPSGK